MLKITVYVNAPAASAQGVKESLAMYLERWGDANVAEVRDIQPKDWIEEQKRQKQQQNYFPGR